MESHAPWVLFLTLHSTGFLISSPDWNSDKKKAALLLQQKQAEEARAAAAAEADRCDPQRTAHALPARQREESRAASGCLCRAPRQRQPEADWFADRSARLKKTAQSGQGAVSTGCCFDRVLSLSCSAAEAAGGRPVRRAAHAWKGQPAGQRACEASSAAGRVANKPLM